VEETWRLSLPSVPTSSDISRGRFLLQVFSGRKEKSNSEERGREGGRRRFRGRKEKEKENGVNWNDIVIAGALGFVVVPIGFGLYRVDYSIHRFFNSINGFVNSIIGNGVGSIEKAATSAETSIDGVSLVKGGAKCSQG